jgi:hypothetical protein
MAKATALYRSIMAEVERRRNELNVPMWAVDDRSGTQDGYYAKALYAETRTGRQSTWPTLQLIIDSLYPGGVDVELRALNDGVLGAPGMVTKDPNAPGRMIRHWRHRRHFQELGRKGALAYREKVSPGRRSAFARRAARARWKQARDRKS